MEKVGNRVWRPSSALREERRLAVTILSPFLTDPEKYDDERYLLLTRYTGGGANKDHFKDYWDEENDQDRLKNEDRVVGDTQPTSEVFEQD